MAGTSDLLFMSRLNACYDSLSPTERKVADYMKENLVHIPKESAQSISEKAGVGVATVMRFCKSLGFSGLMELKLSLKRQDMVYEHLADTDVKPGDSVAVIKQKVLAYHIEAVENMTKSWNEEELEQACEALLHAKRIVVSGAGSARTSALTMHDCLHMLGMSGDYYADPVDEVYALGKLKKGDVFVGFSYSGRFRRTLECFKIAKERGVTTIGILGTVGSPCSEYSDIVLYSHKSQKKLYFGTQSNTIGDFYIIELLYSILASRKKNIGEASEHLHNLVNRLRVEK